MTAPYFDFTRPDYGLAQRPDATRVGQKQPKLTAKEAGRQTLRGLGRAGIETLFSIGAGLLGLHHGNVPAAIASINPARERELEALDEYYGKPETGGGRGVALVSELLGGAAIPLGPLKRAPAASRSAQRTVPVVRAASNDELKKVADALRRAPEGSKERRLLEDILARPERPVTGITESRRQPQVDIPIRDLEDLLNLRAFGSRRGPFSTSGKHAYDLGDLPPIADADEILAFGSRRSRDNPVYRRNLITEQMRDPDYRSGKAAQRELRDETQRNKEVTAEWRDAIINEEISPFMRAWREARLQQGDPLKPGEAVVKLEPRSLWQMFFNPRGSRQ